MTKLKDAFVAIALSIALFQIVKGFGDAAREVHRDRKLKRLAAVEE